MNALEFYYILDKTFKNGVDHKKVKEERRKGKNINIHYHPDPTTIYICCTAGKYMKVSTKQRIKPSEWDFTTQKAKPTSENAMRLNMYLQNLKAKASAEYIQMLDKGMPITYDSIKAVLQKLVGKVEEVPDKKDFWTFFDEFLKDKSKLRKPETIAKYRSLKVSLVKFEKEHYTLTFDKMTMKFYNDFLHFSQSNLKHLNNTISKSLRGLKTFLRWAQEMNYSSIEDYKKFKGTNDQNEPMYLTLEEFRLFEAFHAEESSKLEASRDIFLFQCYTGQRISDVLNFRKKDIKNDKEYGHFWELYQQKGAKKYPVKIPLPNPAQVIFDKYTKNSKMDDYVFPRQSGQLINKNLKTIAEAAGIVQSFTKMNFSGNVPVNKTASKSKLISTHAARRTFVTLATEAGMNSEQIMAITGHTSASQVRVYTGMDRLKLKERMEKVFKN